MAGGGAAEVAVPGDWSPSPHAGGLRGWEQKRWGYLGFWPGRVEFAELAGDMESCLRSLLDIWAGQRGGFPLW